MADESEVDSGQNRLAASASMLERREQETEGDKDLLSFIQK